MAYTVNQLAKLAGVTVRTLHHYDRIGLLKPAYSQKNGYRQYTQPELLRLQQILFYRELGFALPQIRAMLNSPTFDALRAYNDQQHLLKLEIKRLEGLVQTINKTINKMKGKTNMTDQDLYGGFSREEMERYQEEARQRWGHTDAFKQSMARTKNWTPQDYQKALAPEKEIVETIIAHMSEGVESPIIQKQVERHRQVINQFYDCTLEIYRGLAHLYVEDQRFADHYRKFHPKLPEFLSQAMIHYCDQKEKK